MWAPWLGQAIGGAVRGLLLRQTDNRKIPANPQSGNCGLDAKARRSSGSAGSLSRLTKFFAFRLNSQINAIGTGCARTAGQLLGSDGKVMSALEGPADYGAEFDSCGSMITDHFSMPA